jgi:60Kd inner membrane protein
MPSASDGNGKWPVVLSDGLYRRLLVLYPKAFRAAYGAEIAQVFRDRVRQAYRAHGATSVLTLWPAALHDLVANAAAEQARQERHVPRTIVVLAVVLVVVIIVGEYLYYAAPHIYFSILTSIFDPIATVAEPLVIKPVFNLLVVVYGLVHSLPLALVILTLAFQLCLLPLTRRLLTAARVLPALQPQLQQLHEHYRGEPQALRMAQRDLYRRHGIKPVSITVWLTVWLLIQMPFLYALYWAFLTKKSSSPPQAAGFQPKRLGAPGLSQKS